MFVGQEPGADEVVLEEPLVGPSGREWERGIEKVGWFRHDVDVNNVLACQPPTNLKFYLGKIRAENKRRAKRGEEPIADPIACCTPRLLSETARYPFVVPLGAVATGILVPRGAEQKRKRSFTAQRGKMIELERLPHDVEPPSPEYVPGRKLLPTYNPARVVRDKGLRKVFHKDLDRAMRFYEGRIEWADPWILAHPTVEEIHRFLTTVAWEVDESLREPWAAIANDLAARRGMAPWTTNKVHVFDTETGFAPGYRTDWHTIQIGTPHHVLVIPLASRHDPNRRFYSPEEYAWIQQILTWWATTGEILKVGWNSADFDRMVLEQDRHLAVVTSPHVDLIQVKRSVQPDTPHGLGFAGSFYSDVHDWKCYDGQTEVLTRRGWVRFDQLERGLEVAQWCDGEITFVRPSAYTDEPYAGAMIRLESDALDLLVTPNHKMLIWSASTDRDRVCEAGNMPRTGSMYHAGLYRGGSRSIDPMLLRLLVAMQADGSWAWNHKYQRERGDRPNRLDFGFTKARKIERLRWVLDSLGMSYDVRQTGSVTPRTRIWVAPHPIIEWLWDHLGAKKEYGPWLLEITPEGRALVAEESSRWDGTYAKRNYTSKNGQNAAWVQACHVLGGRQARARDYGKTWRVNVPRTGQPRAQFRNARIAKKSFEGRVYCVTVPSGFLLVRRDGKVTVSGNSDHTATEASSDNELWRYGGIDVAVTAQTGFHMTPELVERDQVEVCRVDHRIQNVCVGMTRTGIRIHEERRAAFEEEYLRRVRKWGLRCRKILHESGLDPDGVAPKLSKKKRKALYEETGLAIEEEEDGWDLLGAEDLGPEFVRWNPGSHVQLRHILFEEWALEPPSDLRPKELLTSSGELSTGDTVIRALLQRSHLEDYQRLFLRAVRNFRKVSKILGTYLLPMRPHDAGGKLVEADGRVRPRWLNFIPITGRLASRGPNNQNVPKWLRAMFIPSEGHVFVGADKDQLELRVGAMLWGVQRYLDAFQTLEDPHQVTMAVIYGEGDVQKGIQKMLAMPGAPPTYGSKAFASKSPFEKERKLSKTVQFGAQYGARGPVLHRIVTAAEDKEGNFIFGHLQLEDAEALREAWLQGCPEYEKGWAREKQEAIRQGYLREPFGGRRRDFVDGGDNLSEIANFKVQSGAAAIVNQETIELEEAIPHGLWSPTTGVVNQTHDQLVVEVPEDRAEEAKAILSEIMGNRRYDGWPIPFTAGPSIADDWSSLG